MKITPLLISSFFFFYSLSFVSATATSYTFETLPKSEQDTIIQNYHRDDQVKATSTEALVRVKVTDMRKNILSETPLWVHNKQGQYWQGTTDKNGEVFFLLPHHQKYTINVDQEANYRKFSIPKEANFFKTVRVVYMSGKVRETERNDTIYQANNKGMSPTLSRVLVKIKIKDLENRGIPKEVLCFDAQTSGKTYYSETDRNGESSLMLPKGDTYCIHSYAFRDITCKTFEQSNTSRTSRFEFTTLSAAAFKEREIERQRLLAMRDSIRHLQRIQDSIYLTQAGNRNFYLQHAYHHADFDYIEEKISTLAQQNRKDITLNPDHFKENKEEIKSILQRNKNNWPQKRIVANIDCSMYQYIDELLVWNYMDEQEQLHNKYFLFNGFNYLDQQKDEQNRRGIFPVAQNNVKSFMETIDKIVNFECTGSRLENVVEALLLGAKGKSDQEDLLFIADNYSDVSDLHLLEQLKVPVHVLLTASKYGINENYLEIAYRTGGSIHTMNEDVGSKQLQNLKNGQQLRIGTFIYTFYKGKFLKVNA